MYHYIYYINYEEKYLKYKSKYYNLKYGGSLFNNFRTIVNNMPGFDKPATIDDINKVADELEEILIKDEKVYNIFDIEPKVFDKFKTKVFDQFKTEELKKRFKILVEIMIKLLYNYKNVCIMNSNYNNNEIKEIAKIDKISNALEDVSNNNNMISKSKLDEANNYLKDLIIAKKNLRGLSIQYNNRLKTTRDTNTAQSGYDFSQIHKPNNNAVN